MFRVNPVGSLPDCEIVTLIMPPFLLLRHGPRRVQERILVVLSVSGLCLFATVVGDRYFGSSITIGAKGIARVIFLGLDSMTLVILIDGKTRGKGAFTLGFVPVMLYIGLAFRRAWNARESA
jgi:hypothetical protein